MTEEPSMYGTKRQRVEMNPSSSAGTSSTAPEHGMSELLDLIHSLDGPKELTHPNPSAQSSFFGGAQGTDRATAASLGARSGPAGSNQHPATLASFPSQSDERVTRPAMPSASLGQHQQVQASAHARVQGQQQHDGQHGGQGPAFLPIGHSLALPMEMGQASGQLSVGYRVGVMGESTGLLPSRSPLQQFMQNRAASAGQQQPVDASRSSIEMLHKTAFQAAFLALQMSDDASRTAGGERHVLMSIADASAQMAVRLALNSSQPNESAVQQQQHQQQQQQQQQQQRARFGRLMMTNSLTTLTDGQLALSLDVSNQLL